MKKVLVMCYSRLSNDPRVLRQIDALSKDYDVYTAGYNAPEGFPESKFVRIGDDFNTGPHFSFSYLRLLRFPFKTLTHLTRKMYRVLLNIVFLRKLKWYESYYWSIYRKRDLNRIGRKFNVDLIVANDLIAVPLAVRLKNRWKAKLIFDAHEYSPLQYEHFPHWKKYNHPQIDALLKKYLPEVDVPFTVSEGIANKYKEVYGREFRVMWNAPHYDVELNPSEMKKETINFVHHGIASAARKQEVMVEAFKALPDNYVLHLMLMRMKNNYYDQLLEMCEGVENIVFVEPVPTTDIAKTINKYDMGIAVIPPTNFNYRNCLPNKFFEFIQGRLGIITGPTPEMKKYVEAHDLGVVTEGFETEDLIKAIKSVNREDIDRFKKNVNEISEQFSSVQPTDVLLKAARELI